jgi:PucR C-terminal helix-turn-helix domain
MTVMDDFRPIATCRIIPAAMIDSIFALVPGIAEGMALEIAARVPEYRRDRDPAHSSIVVMTTTKVLTDLLGRAAGRRCDGSTAELFRRAGKVEAHYERSLDDLQSAMHVGCDVMWQRLSAACLDRGLPKEDLCRLAEVLLAQFRENTLAASDGYTQARTRLTSEVQRNRRHLLELVLSDPPVSPAAVAKVAASAQWKLPETVAVVVLGARAPSEFSALNLPQDILVDLDRDQPCLVVPEPGRLGRTRLLELALDGCAAVVGPPLPLAAAVRSLHWAQEALRLAERGVIDSTAVIHCSDHMSTLVIFQNEDLVDTLAESRLAPLAQLRMGLRDRLAETLLAWLQTGGDAVEAAARLHVHPQTVRYRIRQLREIFGDRLADPEAQLELEIVLRARQLAARAAARGRGGKLPGPLPLNV